MALRQSIDFNDNFDQGVVPIHDCMWENGFWYIVVLVLTIYAVTSFVFVCSSITGFCAETLPVMYTLQNITRQCGPDQPLENIISYQSHPFLEYLDYTCTTFFTMELLVRIVFAPRKLFFFKTVMNIIDILALLPLYVQITLSIMDRYDCLKNNRAVLETIFVLRIIRIFRIFHLVKNYKALKILVHAMRASVQELMMLSIFLLIAMLVFSTLIFYAERKNPGGFGGGDFDTIPIGFWWSIITMTTVGYGDIYPTTWLGQMIGALCAVWGVLLVALTIPVISNNFTLFYLHARTRDVLAKKEKQINTVRSDRALRGNESTISDCGGIPVGIKSSTTMDESGLMLTVHSTKDNESSYTKQHSKSTNQESTIEETEI